MAKGQMEMFGLVIIAVLGAIFLVFALANSAKQSPKLQHESFEGMSLGNGFINTLVNTEVAECGIEYEALVKDCARGPSITCDDKSSCHWINVTAHKIINETLDRWGEEYRYTVTRAGTPVIPEISYNCGENDEKAAPGIQVIPLYPTSGNAEVRLDVCT